MLTDRLITVAIHTYERAHRLKSLLEKENIKVSLQNVNLTNPSISAGVRVRIKECDLPQALRIIENLEVLEPSTMSSTDTHEDGGTILVPVDFSDYSLRATLVAFRIAAAKNARIHLLHTFLDPAMTGTSMNQLSDTLNYGVEPDPVEEVMTDMDIEHALQKSMDEFQDKIRDKIRSGVIPGVKFTGEVIEGLPEEMIDEYASTHHNLLTVMGTHGSGDNRRDMVGSVTAEVLDNCRTPVLTIPGNTSWAPAGMPSSALFFATPNQEDILVLDTLYRMLPDTALSVTIVALPDRRHGTPSEESLQALLKYCRESYPAFTFKASPVSLSNPIADFEKLAEQHPIDLIVIGNKKKNIFSRLFNPTLAHRLLYHADVALLSIPVNG